MLNLRDEKKGTDEDTEAKKDKMEGRQHIHKKKKSGCDEREKKREKNIKEVNKWRIEEMKKKWVDDDIEAKKDKVEGKQRGKKI